MEITITRHAWLRFAQRSENWTFSTEAVLSRIRAAVRIDPPRGRDLGDEYWHDPDSRVIWVMKRIAPQAVKAVTCISEGSFIRQCEQMERLSA